MADLDEDDSDAMFWVRFRERLRELPITGDYEGELEALSDAAMSIFEGSPPHDTDPVDYANRAHRLRFLGGANSTGTDGAQRQPDGRSDVEGLGTAEEARLSSSREARIGEGRSDFSAGDSRRVRIGPRNENKGGRPSRGERVTIQTRVPHALANAVWAEAAWQGMYVSDLVAVLIADALGIDLHRLDPAAPQPREALGRAEGRAEDS